MEIVLFLYFRSLYSIPIFAYAPRSPLCNGGNTHVADRNGNRIVETVMREIFKILLSAARMIFL